MGITQRISRILFVSICLMNIFSVAALAKDELQFTVFASEKNLTINTARYLADIAEPIQFVSSKQKTVGELVTEACGRIDQHYLKILIERDTLKGLVTTKTEAGGKIDADSKLTQDRTITLPFCLRLPEKKQANLTAYAWSKRGYFKRPSTMGLGSKTNVANWLAPGSEIMGSNGRQVAPWTQEQGAWNIWNSSAYYPSATPSKAGFPASQNAKQVRNHVSKTTDVWKRLAENPASSIRPNSISNAYMRKTQGKANFKNSYLNSLTNLRRHQLTAPTDKYLGGTKKRLIRISKIEKKSEYGGLASIPLKKTLNKTRLASLATDFTNATIADVLTAKKAVADRPSLSTFQFISNLSSADARGCLGTRDENQYPVKQSDLLRVLYRNAQHMRENGLQRKKPVTIIVADSGIFNYQKPPLHKNHFAWPRSGSGKKKVWQASVEFKDRMHGTYVTTAALGTRQLLGLTALLDTPVNIVERTIVENQQINTDLVANALSLRGDEASIINLSFIGPQAEASLGFAIGQERQLYVVAAGNNGALDPMDSRKKIGKKLGRGKEFPAIFENNNLITVGAHNELGLFAGFSNWSPKYVQLAAPGCGIPVYQYNTQKSIYVKIDSHGTSMAAPLVSFAAALVKVYSRYLGPHEIKQRLLASADMVDRYKLIGKSKSEQQALKQLPQKVEHGRILNIPKALALFHDVLTSKEGEPFQIGKVIAPNSIELCGEIYRLKDLRKIVPFFINQEGDERTLVYSIDGKGAMTPDNCKLDAQKLSKKIEFKPADLDQDSKTYTLDELREIVFSGRS